MLFIIIRPLSGVIIPAMAFNVTDFPQPDLPNIPVLKLSDEKWVYVEIRMESECVNE